MTVTPDDGEATDVAAGDLVVFPRGRSGTWDIPTPLTKAYLIY